MRMHFAEIISTVAALIVVGASVLRVHALRWSVAPLAMLTALALAMYSATVACRPLMGLPTSIEGTILHCLIALNALADWESTRCEHESARSCPVRFQL